MKTTIKGVRKLKKGTRDYFFAQVSSDIVKEIVRVPTIEASLKTYLLEDSKDGYQRSAQISRMSKFKTFLNTYPDQIVPPILLSDRSRWEFVPSKDDDNFGEFYIASPAFVIDGQHRLGGYVAHFEEFDEPIGIDFILIKDLTREEEIKEFTTINGTAVGVPKQLNTWLNVQMDDGASKFDFAAVSAMKEEMSVFKNCIQGHSAKKKGEHYKLHSVAGCFKHMFRHSVFDDMDHDQIYETWNQFWWLVRRTHQDIWNEDIERDSPQKMDFKLLELTGLVAYSQAADDILTRSYDHEKNEFNWDGVEACLEFLNDFDWRKNGEFEGITGTVGGSKIARELKRDILAFYSSN